MNYHVVFTERARKELKKLEEEITVLKSSYELYSKTYFEISEKNVEYANKISELRERKEKLYASLESKKTEFNEKSFAYNIALKSIETLKLELQELNENKTEYIEKRENAIVEIEKLKKSIENIKNETGLLENERVEAKEFLEKYRNENPNVTNY